MKGVKVIVRDGRGMDGQEWEISNKLTARVPAVYLSSAILAILLNQASCRISNLRVISTPS